ncbi:MAG: hypothetical protein NZM04_04455 [Methylacidiphilales bacterium]|nr:hypothetical protein [Candidatus Methylacidiphilales bacterium]
MMQSHQFFKHLILSDIINYNSNEIKENVINNPDVASKILTNRVILKDENEFLDINKSLLIDLIYLGLSKSPLAYEILEIYENSDIVDCKIGALLGLYLIDGDKKRLDKIGEEIEKDCVSYTGTIIFMMGKVGKIKDKIDEDIFDFILKHGNDRFDYIISAIGNIGSERSVEYLSATLEYFYNEAKRLSYHKENVKIIVEAICQCDNPGIINILISALNKDLDDDIKKMVIERIGEIGGIKEYDLLTQICMRECSILPGIIIKSMANILTRIYCDNIYKNKKDDELYYNLSDDNPKLCEYYHDWLQKSIIYLSEYFVDLILYDNYVNSMCGKECDNLREISIDSIRLSFTLFNEKFMMEVTRMVLNDPKLDLLLHYFKSAVIHKNNFFYAFLRKNIDAFRSFNISEYYDAFTLYILNNIENKELIIDILDYLYLIDNRKLKSSLIKIIETTKDPDRIWLINYIIFNSDEEDLPDISKLLYSVYDHVKRDKEFQQKMLLTILSVKEDIGLSLLWRFIDLFEQNDHKKIAVALQFKKDEDILTSIIKTLKDRDHSTALTIINKLISLLPNKMYNIIEKAGKLLSNKEVSNIVFEIIKQIYSQTYTSNENERFYI